MINKIPSKKIEFSEQDEEFIKQLAKDIGCNYSKANARTYSLTKNSSPAQGETGAALEPQVAFAWVHKEENNYFWVATRKTWIEAARVKDDADRKKSAAPSFQRDTRQADDSVSFDMRGNYEKTVISLKLVYQMQ
jgi:ABC-type sugar transport system substrate-binding protein